MDNIELLDFQKNVFSIPESYDLFLGGGRGGSKSFTMALLALRYSEQYGPKARILYIRKTHKALADFEALTRDLFGKIYGREASYNATEHFWRMPNKAYFELGQLENDNDYLKYQGRSFGLLLIDEAGQYSTPRLLDKLRSNLRGPGDIPIRTGIAANPGGVGHQWLAKRFVFGDHSPWKPYSESNTGRTFVNCPSTFEDNPFIDQSEYKKQLEASLSTDKELLKAWLYGDWTVARGAYFGSVLDEQNTIGPVDELPIKQVYHSFRAPEYERRDQFWDHWLAFDYGSSAPSVCYLMLQSPGAELDGRYYPKDSIIIVDELATNDPNDLNKGLEYTIPHQADLIKELCDRWDIKPRGVADDACFSKLRASNSIADEFRREGIYFKKARKGSRKTGWEKMRTLLDDAGKPDRPGLYISRTCKYFWATVPYLGRDKRDPEDLDTTEADHGADACRYGIGRKP
jgi:hypothetical protein